MSRIETAMTRWLVYVQMHLLLPFDYRVFTPILEKLRKHVQARSTPSSATVVKGSTPSKAAPMPMPMFEQQTEKDLKEFDVMAEKFTVQAIAFIRRHRYYLGNNYDKYYVQVSGIIIIIVVPRYKGGSPGQVVMGGDSCCKGGEFESQRRILYGHFSHIFVVKNVMMFVWKEAEDGPFKKMKA